ncbi:MAG: HAD-IB family hydrolase [Planctomycetota bacterium]|nr:HAD-IB family hydrolase [Planctomycetota bacterium]
MTEASPSNPPKKAVFFDVDGTLLTKNSGPLYAKWLYKQELISGGDLLSSAYYMLQYKLDWLDATALYEKIAKRSQGEAVEMHRDRGRRFYDEVLKDIIRHPLVKVLEDHRQAGDVVAILTASTPILVDPLAKELKMEHLLCSQLEIDDNDCYTGKLACEPCFGIGKVNAAKRFCETHGLVFEDSVAYADSMTDRPLLAAVKHPRVVEPDPLLRRVAKKENWPIWSPEAASIG